MSEPTFTIVIPCYNGGRYLADALGSVAAQRVNCEVILVDDGSQENWNSQAQQLLDQFSLSGLVVRQPNQGPGTARTTGLACARGKYVGFLDVDDKYHPDFCRTLADTLDHNPQFVAADCEIELFNVHRPAETWQIRFMEQFLPSNLLVRTELARLVGGFPTDPAYRGKAAGEDTSFRNALKKVGSIAHVTQPLCQYRCQPGSHYDYFLDRNTRQGTQIATALKAQEELDGQQVEAEQEYFTDIARRQVSQMRQRFCNVILQQSELQQVVRHEGLSEAAPVAVETLALWKLARDWPGPGATVVFTQAPASETVLIARACQAGRRGNVTILCPAPVTAPPAIDALPDVSTPTFQRRMQQQGVAETVQIVRATDVTTPVSAMRLLFVDSSAGEAFSAEVLTRWIQALPPAALLVLQSDVADRVNPLSERLERDFPGQWREFGKVVRTSFHIRQHS